MKLSKPQWFALVDVSEGNRHFVRSYSPAKKLVELGLCEWRDGKYGSSWLDLTDAGRAALSQAKSNGGEQQ